VDYDYLVIASGSSTLSTLGKASDVAPFKHTGNNDIQSSIKTAQHEIAAAKSIVIAGAGPAGIEFAGEIADTL
jgi:NADH dehydrogenase FAD-containing subunit